VQGPPPLDTTRALPGGSEGRGRGVQGGAVVARVAPLGATREFFSSLQHMFYLQCFNSSIGLFGIYYFILFDRNKIKQYDNNILFGNST
jgi:hypothetical protein